MAERTESSIIIDAPPAQVLDVIADFESYPRWATEVREVEILASSTGAGRAGAARPDQVRFTLDAGPVKDTYTLAYDWGLADDSTGAVSWSLVEAGVLKTMDGSYTLEVAPGTDGSSTTVVYRLAADLKVPMLGMLRRKAEKVIVTTALTELKKRVEQGG